MSQSSSTPFANNQCTSTDYVNRLLRQYIFFCSLLKQMPLFPLTPSLLTKISFMVPGIRFLLIVLKKSCRLLVWQQN